MNNRIIYVLTDPITKQVRYVGCCYTYRKSTRMWQHKHPDTEDSNKDKKDWIKGLQAINKNPIMEVIEEVSDTNWEERERFWIGYYKDCRIDLLNKTEGGAGSPGHKASEETLIKMRAYRPSIETREKISKAHIGKKMSDEAKKNLSLAKKGKPLTHAQITGIKLAIRKNPQCRARYRKGEANGRAILNEDKVNLIRKIKDKYSNTVLAIMFGVSVSTIKNIKNRKLWGHI